MLTASKPMLLYDLVIPLGSTSAGKIPVNELLKSPTALPGVQGKEGVCPSTPSDVCFWSHISRVEQRPRISACQG